MLQRVLFRSVACSSCRSKVLRSFIAISEVPIRPTSQSSTLLRTFQGITPAAPSRFLSDTKEARPADSEKQDEISGEYHPQDVRNTSSSTPDGVVVVPWYLQVETPQLSSQHPLAERQAIPKVPEGSPPILEGMLTHISVEIGLDDLALLDLRALNPPPALGANLLMIIGTARSVKHLNVSADRLCRWLRSNHKLRPYADGLLGRNELKLKLRRKARRAKLASSVGSTVDINRDDGITTGWICVNVGTVSGPDGDAIQEVEQPEGFVGFGQRSVGPQIVVQMLTEEKRTELDLENLWGKRLARKEAMTSPEEWNFDPKSDLPSASSDSRGGAASHPSPLSGTEYIRQRIQSIPQKRAFHSARSLQLPEATTSASATPETSAGPDHTTVDLSAEPGTESLDFQQVFDSSRDHEGLQSADYSLATLEYTFDENAAARRIDVSTHIQRILDQLKSMSSSEAIESLGNGVDDRESSPLLSDFYSTLSGTPSQVVQEYQLLLACHAIALSHPKYSKRDLAQLFRATEVEGHHVSSTVASHVIETLSLRPSSGPSTSQIFSGSLEPTVDLRTCGIHLALNLLSLMRPTESDESSNIFQSLMGKVNAAILQEEAHQEQSEKADTSLPDPWTTHKNLESEARLMILSLARQRLQDHAVRAHSLSAKTSNYINLLRLHAQHGNWQNFWRVWHSIPLKMEPRSEELYALMFKALATKGVQRECRDVIFEWVPMMEREVPPVSLEGDVAKAVMDCLLVAEPGLGSFERKFGPSEELWLKCRKALSE